MAQYVFLAEFYVQNSKGYKNLKMESLSLFEILGIFFNFFFILGTLNFFLMQSAAW